MSEATATGLARAAARRRLRGPVLFWRGRAAGPVLAAALVMVILAVTPLGGVLVPVGVLTGSSDRSVAARTVLTLTVAAIVIPVTEQPLAELERSARRTVRAWQWSAVVLTLLLGCATMWVIAAIAGSASGPLVRNVLGLTGIALVARAWWGRLAWIAPLVWVMASVLFGDQGGVGATTWAWPIDEQSAPEAWVWSAGSLAVGLMCLGWSWRRAGG